MFERMNVYLNPRKPMFPTYTYTAMECCDSNFEVKYIFLLINMQFGYTYFMFVNQHASPDICLSLESVKNEYIVRQKNEGLLCYTSVKARYKHQNDMSLEHIRI